MKKIAITLIGLSAAQLATASDWNFEAFANASLVHTDNVTLNIPADAESDTILLLNPLFNLTRESARLDFDLSYNPQAVFYDKTEDADQVFHVLDGTMTAELAKERLFLDLTAAKFQTIVSPDGSFPVDNIPVSNNRADTTVFTINPYWQQRFGSTDLRIDAQHTRTELDDESIDTTPLDLQSNRRNTAGLYFGSVAQQKGVTWAVAYDYQRVEYDESIPWEYQKASLELGVWVNDAVRFFGTVGQETPFDDYFSGKPEDTFWDAGVEYAPNARLNAQVSAGERSFGSSVRASMSYRTQRAQTTLTYSEEPQTQGALFAGRRPLRDIDNLDGLLDRAGDSDRLIRKRGELATTWSLPKSTIAVRVFNERRTDRTTATGDILPGDELTGAAFRFDWRFGARTSANFTADAATRSGGLEDNDFWRTGVGLTYAFSTRLNMTLDLQHVEQNGEAASRQNYDVNRGTLSVSMQF